MLDLDPFVPHPLVPTGYFQTVLGHFLGKVARWPDYVEHHVLLADGDRLVLHLDHPVGQQPKDPVVVLLHGLGGCSESFYILRMSQHLTKLGYDVVRFNHRTCGRGALPLARQIYHAGRTEDVFATVASLEEKWPDRPIVLVGFSLSGNMILKFAAEHASSDVARSVKSILAVCPPVDLDYCSRAFTRPENFAINQYYTRMLINVAKRRKQVHGLGLEQPFPWLMDLRRFDELYTSRQSGFRDAMDYYSNSSAGPHLHKIRLPTTILAAKDDPLIPGESFDSVVLSPAVTLRMEKGGGHMGFLAKHPTFLGNRKWLDAAVVRWIQRVLP